jgi:hypothetical protein
LDEPPPASGPPRFAREVLRLDGVRRLFAIGDVQSNYQALIALLATAGFAEERDGVPVWTGGDATLLFLGDLLDGGTQPAEVLWLFMRLCEGAGAAGGRVVLVQGNHELMLLDVADASAGELPGALARWFANGGMETLLRLASAVGLPVGERLVAQMYTATLADPENDGQVQRLAHVVRGEYADELAFLRRHMRPAVAVNGALLAVHAAPRFDAGLDGFVASGADETYLAWSRGWLLDWEPQATGGVFLDRLAALKARLRDTDGAFELRMLLFAHTPLSAFAVSGFRDKQYRIGRLTGPDQHPGAPATYDLLTAPREVPRGGALGGLLFDVEGVTALYSADGVGGPQRERLDGPDPAFRG